MNRRFACIAFAVLLYSFAAFKALNGVPQQPKPKEEPETQSIKVKTELMEVRTVARTRALNILSEAAYLRRTTVSILKDFAEQMIGLPGKRMIVIFSEGFTLLDNDGQIHNDELQSAIDRAVRSGVVIYSIDVKGVQAPPTQICF